MSQKKSYRVELTVSYKVARTIETDQGTAEAYRLACVSAEDCIVDNASEIYEELISVTEE